MSESEIVDTIIQEIEQLFQYYNCGSSILDIIYNVVTLLMLIVSAFSLFVACRVYRQSGIIHKENMDLTRKMHADSLTPFLVIKSVCGYICLRANRYPYMEIVQMDMGEKVYLNSKTEIDISEIIGKVQIEVVIYNISEIPAVAQLKCEYLGIEKIICEYLAGKEEKVIRFEEEILSLEKNVLNEVIHNCVYMNYNLNYNGPGMSAEDTVLGKIKLHYSSTESAVNLIIEQTAKKREYKGEL